MAVRGVRNSCEASAVKRRNCSKAPCSLPSIAFNTAPSLPNSSSRFWTDSRAPKSLCGYFLRFAGHRVNRCQCFASQGVPSEAGKQYSKRKSNEQDGGELPELAPHRLLVVGNPKNNYGVVEMVWAAGEPDSQTVRKTLGDWDDVFPCLFRVGGPPSACPRSWGVR